MATRGAAAAAAGVAASGSAAGAAAAAAANAVVAEVPSGEWSMRIASSGGDDPHVSEVTLSASAALRRRYAAIQYAVQAVLAVVCVLVPAPAAVSAALDAVAGAAVAWAAGVLAADRHLAALADGFTAGEAGWVRFGGELVLRLFIVLALSRLVPQFVVEESVLAMRHLGVQLRRVTTGGGAKYAFYDASSVEALIVNEGIQTCAVRYYMALVVTGRRSLVLAFDASRPRLPVLSAAFTHLHAVMFPEAHLDDALYAELRAGRPPSRRRWLRPEDAAGDDDDGSASDGSSDGGAKPRPSGLD